MIVSTEGIVLHNIRYADKKIISKIYTKQFGLVSANIHVGSATKSKIKPGIIQPLNQLELVFNFRENKDLQQVSDARCIHVYNDLHANMYKLSIALFLNEVLYKSLKEQVANEELYNYITHTYQWLDLTEGDYLDTHLYFLFELTKFLGFYPTNNYDNVHLFFDTQEGKFTNYLQSFPTGFNMEQSKLVASLFENRAKKEIIYTRAQRVSLLECLSSYYKTQIVNIKEINSYKVLQEVLG